MNEENGNKLLCLNCWNPLQTFHDLYVKVQEAHQTLQEWKTNFQQEIVETKPLEILTEQLEEDQDCELLENTKHGSKRVTAVTNINLEVPQKKFKTKMKNTKEHFAKELETEILIKTELDLCNEFIELQNEFIDESPQLIEKRSKDIAVESTSNGEYVEHLDKSNSEDATEKQEYKKLKKIPSEKYIMSKERDEYIAKNFKLCCSLCSATLSNFAQLKKHFRKIHKMRGYAICCNKKFLQRSILVDHIEWHKNPNLFRCELCQKSYKDKRCLDLHIASHTQSQERIYKCQVCSKSFFKKCIYKIHLRLHDEKNFSCMECDKK